MKINIAKNNKGETLVEILIYVAITSIVIGSFVSFALLINELRVKTLSIKKVQTSINEVFNLLDQEIKNCEKVIEPYSKASSSRLVLDARNESDNHTIEIIDGIVYLTKGSEAPIKITSNDIYIDKLSFLNLAEESGKDVLYIEIESRYRYAHSQAFEFSLADHIIIGRKY